jgi:guanine deaminase
VTLYRGTFLDTPHSPFKGHHLRADQDAALLVRDGVIAARGPADAMLQKHPGEEVVDLRHGLVLPGFVDTHVHYPQVRAIGGLGLPLLDWLERCALPEEARLADATYAASVAADFVDGLARAGTTTALVFGSHFATAVDALFTEATRVGLRMTSGLVLSDRILREDLFTDPDRAYAEGSALAERWHGVGRTRYAVTPRFSLSCTNPLLASAGALLRDVPGSYFTSHLNENPEEIRGVRELFGCDYTATYDQHGLLTERSVLAHNVHPTRSELQVLGRRGVSVAHCPTSNAALGSGLFPLGSHLAFGVRVALGSDVGAGTGFSLFKEGLQAYFAQQLLGLDGHRLTAGHLLHLATAAGADALGLAQTTGDLSVGKEYDALWLSPEPGTTLDVALRHAHSPDDALAKAFALASPADVRQTWVAGDAIRR